MHSRTFGNKTLVEFVGLLFSACSLRQASEWSILTSQQSLQRGRTPNILLRQRTVRRTELEAVDHVLLRTLRVVAVSVFRPLVGIPSISIGSAISVKDPFQERKGLDVLEFVLHSSTDNV